MFWTRNKTKKTKLKKQQIVYKYSDANMIGLIDEYLKNFPKEDFKVIKVSFIYTQRTITLLFKSSFETRKKIADKLREYDSEAPLIRMQRLMEADAKSEEEELKRYENIQAPVEKEEEEVVEDTGHRINIGDVVIHFKGNKYLILAFAKHTETNKDMVIYQSMNGDKQVWARPYNMFMGKVDKKKNPEAEQEYRFEVYDILAEDEEKIKQARELSNKAISDATAEIMSNSVEHNAKVSLKSLPKTK